MLEALKKSNLLTAEENVFAAMLADAVIGYARKHLRERHRGIPALPEEPTPTGCIWIGDRVILPDTKTNRNERIEA